MNKNIVRRTKQSEFQADAAVSSILKKIYENRGIKDLAEVNHELNTLCNFDKLMGIEAAAELIYQHLQQQNRILILGDFDADGATSSALAVSALNAFGATQVKYLVPNRFEYGYGLTAEIVEVAKQWQPKLLITVDNGISSIEGVAAAKAANIDVLITDHHLPAAILPAADAIVNPNQKGDHFPSKHLAGVGVIFYVMSAVRRLLSQKNWFIENHIPEPNMTQFLDLVALGTVADVVTLDQNNRILVQQGLRRIRANHCRPGIKALLDIAKRTQHKISSMDLAFAIGPRLNAAGRLDDMSIGIECLLAKDETSALALATQLDELNRERREIETEMQQQALVALKKLDLKKNLPIGLCIYDETWHQGVIGILAARIKEQFHRPVIAFAKASETSADEADGNEVIKGSARSIKGLHIRDVLDAIASQHPNLITKFGGHAMAAGLSLPLANYAKFSELFDLEVKKHLTEADLRNDVLSDGELELADFNLATAELLQAAGPWGQNFPEPLFDGEFQIISQRLVGNKHLKMVLGLPNQSHIDAIAFNINVEAWPNHRCEKIRAAYRLDINEYMGRQSLQLLIEHFVGVDAHGFD